MKEITLETVNDGAAKELFARELQNISANINDQNTKAKGKRSLTLTFEFEPDDAREEVKVTVQARAKLMPIKAYTKTAHLGKRNGKVTLYSSDTKQIDMFDEDSGLSKLEKKASSK